MIMVKITEIEIPRYNKSFGNIRYFCPFL